MGFLQMQLKREQLWGQREVLVSAMQEELSNEQKRMAHAWAQV